MSRNGSMLHRNLHLVDNKDVAMASSVVRNERM